MYKGLTATVIKQGTNQMIRFFVYTNLKSHLQGGDPSKDIGSIRTFIIGGIAGAASVFGNTPVDVVKTRMQVCSDSGTPLSQSSGLHKWPIKLMKWVNVCKMCLIR